MSYNRRQYISTIGVVGAAALAGCTGEAELDLVSVEPVDDTIEWGEPFEVEVTTKNKGDGVGTVEVTLSVADIENTESFRISSEEESTDTIQISTDDLSVSEYDYVIQVEGTEETGTVTIEKPDPDFQITDFTVDQKIVQGDSASPKATIENQGGSASTILTLSVEDQQTNTNTELDMGEERVVEIQEPPTSQYSAGEVEYSVGIGSDSATEKVIVASSDPDVHNDNIQIVEISVDEFFGPQYVIDFEDWEVNLDKNMIEIEYYTNAITSDDALKDIENITQTLLATVESQSWRIGMIEFQFNTIGGDYGEWKFDIKWAVDYIDDKISLSQVQERALKTAVGTF